MSDQSQIQYTCSKAMFISSLQKKQILFIFNTPFPQQLQSRKVFFLRNNAFTAKSHWPKNPGFLCISWTATNITKISTYFYWRAFFKTIIKWTRSAKKKITHRCKTSSYKRVDHMWTYKHKFCICLEKILHADWSIFIFGPMHVWPWFAVSV